MAQTFRKLWLLIWKNFILQIRRPVGTVIEILLPVAFLALLILARMNIENKEVCMSNFESQDLHLKSQIAIMNLQTIRKVLKPKPMRIGFYSKDPRVITMMGWVGKGLNTTATSSNTDGTPFTSEEDMINQVKEAPDDYVGAIVFRNIKENKPLPDVVEYDIRLHHKTRTDFDDRRQESWMTKFIYPFFQQPGPRDQEFYSQLFLPIQYQVDSSIIRNYTDNAGMAAPKFTQQFPYPNYREDTFITLIQNVMPTVFALAYVYTAVMIVKELIAEKQCRLKESMKMMGLANWMHWLAWFTKCLLFFLVIIILQTILLKAGKIFEFSDGSVIFVFLLLYVTSSISMLFFLSTLFSNAIRGMLFAAVIWFASLAPYWSFSDPEKYESLPNGAKFGSCLLPNTCLGIAVQIISRRESAQTGMDWAKVSKDPSVDDSFSLGDCFGVFGFDIILYGLLTWYIENVFPGQFGIPKPPYFFLMPSYWCGKKERTGSTVDMQAKAETGDNFEEEPEGVEVGVAIQELRKVYKGATGKKIAVESLSLNIYKGQITALLGHNGAGKTTTMSMLTGLFTPTSGTAYINGNSILDGMDTIRTSLGLCPQHNVLFDRLTVKEHLEFFTALKGLKKNEAAPEIKQMISDIQLTDKANSQSSTLSGGMKRKLNCAIALIGGSQTVFLDEPTSGMDPYARRATWDLLQKYRENKTIVLTTHFMDEADYLGDRIAIMADGQLRCCGSSLYLKKRYGVGYHMTIVKGPDFNENQTQSLVANAIPSSKIVGNIGAEMSYVLEEQSTNNFKGLFEELEDKKDEYGISSFGVSVTTLEEVFLKVGEGETLTGVEETENADDQQKLHAIERSDSKIEREMILNVSIGKTCMQGIKYGPSGIIRALPPHQNVWLHIHLGQQYELLTGPALFFTQFKAMFIKRLLNSKRQKVALVTQIILPLLLVFCGFLLSLASDSKSDDPPLNLTLAMLKEKEELLHTFYGDFRNVDDNELKSRLKQMSKNHFSLVSTQMLDVTDKVNEIIKKNENDSINVLFSDPPVSKSTSDKKNCCSYKYLVLNKHCLQLVGHFWVLLEGAAEINVSVLTPARRVTGNEKFDRFNVQLRSENKMNSEDNLTKLCGTDPKNFGYSGCLKCANSDINVDMCETSTMSINKTLEKLKYKSTYFQEYVLEDSGKDVNTYFNKKVAGLTAERDDIPNEDRYILWFSQQSWHGLPSAFSAGSNILFKYHKNDSKYEIRTRNYPLPRNVEEQSKAATSNDASATLVNFLVMAASFISASFVTFLVVEKTSKAKHIQFVSGVSSWCYWGATFCWDLINYMVPAILILILFAIFNMDEYEGELGYVFLVLLLFGMAMLPFVYLLSFVFTSSLIAYSVIALLLLVLSLGLVIAVLVLNVTGEEKIAETLHYIFMLVPTYTFPQALSDISKNHLNRKACTISDFSRKVCAKRRIPYQEDMLSFELPGIGYHCLYLFLEWIVYFLLVILIEEKFYIPMCLGGGGTSKTFSVKQGEDRDVQEERKKVHDTSNDHSSSVPLLVKDLTKVYRTTGMMAVDHLCFQVSKSQCFGLLGVNGAGKTTTFGMLTGELGISDGTAFVDGYDIRNNLKYVQQRIGYCPQFDALVERMTGREMLRMFARLRGIPSYMLEEVVNAAVNQLNLSKWADKMCGDYSGGNKRKLSTALALVGDPPIVFLDEPTSGMDPASRRFLWNTLSGVMNSGRSIVLTSHSMEECEALCTRLVIMVNGQLKCIGGLQHLKSRFGRGYTLIMKIGATNAGDADARLNSNGHQPNNNSSALDSGVENPSYDVDKATLTIPSIGMKHSSSMQNILENTNQVKDFIQRTFEDAYIIEDRQGFLQYQIVNQDLRWSQIFGAMEENVKRLGIVDYSVSQTSLEQVFINFAKEQLSEDRIFNKTCCSCSCF